MKAINYYILRSVLALIIGLLLVLWPMDAINYLVIAVGVLFLVPGIISIFNFFTRKKAAKSDAVLPVMGLGSLLFGLWLIIMPSFFVTILMYILGFILILGGIQQIVSLSQARGWTHVSLGYYIVPVLILIAGIVVLFNPFSVASAAFILLGISSMVYGLSELFNGIKFKQAKNDTSVTPLN